MATSTAATVLKRKLGLDDVTLFGITCIVGTSWIPAATHTGPASVMLLLLAPCLVAPLAEAANGLTARTIF